MKQILGIFSALLVMIAVAAFSGCFYTVSETQQVIVTKFGEVVGEPISTPGLRFKIPVIHKINRLEKRLLNWDGKPIEIPTKDKAYISVNTFARWRITDAKQFFLRLRDANSAISRLDDILGSETRNAIARHELIEIVRTDKDRKPALDETLIVTDETASEGSGVKIGVLPDIRTGRARIEADIKQGAAPKLKEFGIELLDVRFKQINYNDDVLVRVYQRMISERLQIAERFRSEGGAEVARINGKRERDLNEIQSVAYKREQEIRGEADAEASSIYAEAYGSQPRAAEFYQLTKGLDTYRTIIRPDTTLMLSTDSDLFRLLKSTGSVLAPASAKPATATPAAPSASAPTPTRPTTAAEPVALPSREFEP